MTGEIMEIENDFKEKIEGKKATIFLAVLGIVYGDIGTSPLYAIKECFNGEHALPLNIINIMGVLSLVFWAIVLVIGIKYMLIVLRADNDGEGGILALMTVLTGKKYRFEKLVHKIVFWMGLFGAALLYGDGAITPAISVLSAIEGLKVATPVFETYVIPLTLVILFVLFFFQKYGTGKIGSLFGPIMLLWFLVIGILGLIKIINYPLVLNAVNPSYAWQFFISNGWHAFFILGIIFLVVTGGEALYADLGHFGRKSIQYMWYVVVMPCLILNYFGQGAILLMQPESAINPFYYLIPRDYLYPMVLLATLATIIASQAVISGVFSLTRQAVMLGYIPRVRIKHTSSKNIGQIYIPSFNWLLFFATVFLVLFFRSSGNLAAAYGIAVSLTMVVTTYLLYLVAREKWHLSLLFTFPIFLIFIVIDISFFLANSIKFFQGGWFPIVIAVALFIWMTTWRKGKYILNQRMKNYQDILSKSLSELKFSTDYKVVDGIAIYLTEDLSYVPPAFFTNLKFNKTYHEKLIFLKISTLNIPYVMSKDRIEISNLPGHAIKVKANYGFKQKPDINNVLSYIAEQVDFELDRKKIIFFIGEEILIPTQIPGMNIWREKLFAFLYRNKVNAAEYFGIPRSQVVQLGITIEL